MHRQLHQHSLTYTHPRISLRSSSPSTLALVCAFLFSFIKLQRPHRPKLKPHKTTTTNNFEISSSRACVEWQRRTPSRHAGYSGKGTMLRFHCTVFIRSTRVSSPNAFDSVIRVPTFISFGFGFHQLLCANIVTLKVN